MLTPAIKSSPSARHVPILSPPQTNHFPTSNLLLPEGVYIDSTTGAVTPETCRYVKRLSELSTLFQDTVAASRCGGGW